MLRTVAIRCFPACLLGLFMIVPAPAIHADPISPSYTIADLGNDPTPSFGTYTSGSGITATTVPATSVNTVIIAANGQTAYPFSQPLSSTMMPAPSGFPVPEAAPPAEGGNFPNFSGTGSVTLYPNGIAIALDQLTQSSGDEWQRSDLYYVRQNADGTWGQPVVIAQGPTHTRPDIGQGPGIGAFVDRAGDILVSAQSTQLFGQPTVSLYNVNTQVTTDLSTLPGLAGFSNFRVLSMDQDGRTLVLANNPTGLESDDLLLLTPAGVQSDPIITSAPEPGSWAVMAMALAACVAHRARRHRGRKAA
jgi:hypothetical protein